MPELLTQVPEKMYAGLIHELDGLTDQNPDLPAHLRVKKISLPSQLGYTGKLFNDTLTELEKTLGRKIFNNHDTSVFLWGDDGFYKGAELLVCSPELIRFEKAGLYSVTYTGNNDGFIFSSITTDNKVSFVHDLARGIIRVTTTVVIDEPKTIEKLFPLRLEHIAASHMTQTGFFSE